MSLQEALKLLRLELGMTQSDLAKKLNKAYVTVNRWENGKGFPSRSNSKDILSVARRYNASDECIAYLYEVLMPEQKRGSSAAYYGFPDIEREFLFLLADGSSNAIYVIEADTYKLLYANRRAEAMADRYRLEMGEESQSRRSIDEADRRCFKYFANKSKPCSFCFMKEGDFDGSRDMVSLIPEMGRRFHIHARTAEIKGRKVYAVYLTDVTQEDAERNALYELTNDIPAGVGIYNVYLDNSIELVFMNKILFRMIGDEREKAIMRDELSDFCLVHPEDKGKLMTKIKDSIVTKQGIEIDMSMRIRDKGYCMVHLNARLIKQDKEKFTYYCLFDEK